MRLVVTGARGQVGWELTKSLAPLGEVIALDRAACDLAHSQELPGVVAQTRPDVIVNAAAYTAVDQAEAEESLATLINGTAVGVLAAAARDHGALLVHYSTDYVFDGRKASPYTEDDEPNPLNAYGRSKLAGERALTQAGGDHLILRTSWVYAARGRNFLGAVLRLARERDALCMVDDQIGAPTWARDVAEATAAIVRQAVAERAQPHFASGTFHLTAAGATSWCGFARAIVEEAVEAGLLAVPIPVEAIISDAYPTAAVRPKNSRLSNACVKARFGVALADWRAALHSCIRDPALLQRA